MEDSERGREPTRNERVRALFYAEHLVIPMLQAKEGERTDPYSANEAWTGSGS